MPPLYLWTGDSFYHGPIFLFDDSTNLNAYSKSIIIIARYAHQARCILPAHNLPVIQPAELIEATNAYSDIISGKKKSNDPKADVLRYDFGGFSFLIGKRFLSQLNGSK